MKKLVVLFFTLIFFCFNGAAFALDICGERGGCGRYKWNTPRPADPSPGATASSRAWDFNHQGIAAYNQNDFREAIRLYELALRTAPNDKGAPRYRYNLGLAYHALGAEFARKGDYEEALKLCLLAQQYYSAQGLTHDIARLQAHIERLAAQNRAHELTIQGRNASDQGDLHEAIRLFKLALSADPNGENASIIRSNLAYEYHNLAAELAREDDWEGALKLYLVAQQYYSTQDLTHDIAMAREIIERRAKEAEERRAAEIAAQEAARKEAELQTARTAARELEARREAALEAIQEQTSALLANLRDDLTGHASDGNSTSQKTDLVFMGGSAISAAAGKVPCPPSQDASVVDLCFSEPTVSDSKSGHFESGVELRPEEKKRNLSMIALVQKEGWSKLEQDRLDQALRNLPMDSTPDDGRVRQVWKDMQARGPGSGPAQDAASGDGPLLYRPGQQAHQDCTLYALASAAGLPYGVVAARAGELLRQSEWRSSAERGNPQQVFDDSGGLYSGEVAILAEAFGQAEIIPPSAFSKTLKEGRPVIIGIGMAGGGHEVVLSKTFEHRGEIWYEMMDSNQEDPLRRLYLSAVELDGILLDNGLAFRPEPGRTPKLVR